MNSRTLISNFSTAFSFTTRETNQAQLKTKTLGRPQRHFRRNVDWFWWHWPTIFNDLYKNLQKECTQTQNNEDHVFKKWRTVFLNNWYCLSQIHDLKPIIKRSFRQRAQPKRDSAFEQKTRINSSREIWETSQNRFLNYNQRNKPSRAQKDIFWTYSTSFWKVSVLLKKHKLFL